MVYLFSLYDSYQPVFEQVSSFIEVCGNVLSGKVTLEKVYKSLNIYDISSLSTIYAILNIAFVWEFTTCSSNEIESRGILIIIKTTHFFFILFINTIKFEPMTFIIWWFIFIVKPRHWLISFMCMQKQVILLWASSRTSVSCNCLFD